MPDGACILTHCNAGALATGGWRGTALGVICAAHQAGKRARVLADETRLYLQGARLGPRGSCTKTSSRVEVITASTAAHRFQRAMRLRGGGRGPHRSRERGRTTRSGLSGGCPGRPCTECHSRWRRRLEARWTSAHPRAPRSRRALPSRGGAGGWASRR
ncbi:MAG: hypothetical protein IPH72_30840 [Sandaracinaceae bacterium]|nr:hypothetical protein [Sandaracinaceae bacterium]